MLQDLGADNFSLAAFYRRLEPVQEAWSTTQRDMWTQRTYLLERVLSKTEPSFTCHFQAGANVVIEYAGGYFAVR